MAKKTYTKLVGISGTHRILFDKIVEELKDVKFDTPESLEREVNRRIHERIDNYLSVDMLENIEED